MNWIEVEWRNEKIRVPAQKLNGKLWFHLEGESHCVDLLKARTKEGSTTKGDGIIKAPMPGKILKIFVKDGASVQVGNPILAMEAMKMEYTLEADKEGVVRGLTHNIGDQVALGTVLATIQEG